MLEVNLWPSSLALIGCMDAKYAKWTFTFQNPYTFENDVNIIYKFLLLSKDVTKSLIAQTLPILLTSTPLYIAHILITQYRCSYLLVFMYD